MPNHLHDQTSPYLLEHAQNPVDWYPWGEEAFQRAKQEDKPVFLSIGYSTCHWCHVMARESFMDDEIAAILNQDFIAVKVDKEERPDIDSIYMAVCQAFTGSGGWPTSIFMTPDQKPFFAGTYFPKTGRYGTVGFRDLLLTVAEKWREDRAALLRTAEDVAAGLAMPGSGQGETDADLPEAALTLYKRSYDPAFGGFSRAPKFPAPHNLLFLLTHYEKYRDPEALDMAENTLVHMYKGGLFDHVGYGFCRYSTDRYFLVPHFEKMLYDNALLILAYAKAYELTRKPLYRDVAQKTAAYVLREMTAPEGGFYSAQDADSDGEEGKYYVFTPAETINLLGEEAAAFNRRYGITKEGNFEGKSIPNLLHEDDPAGGFDALLPKLREYRRARATLKTDDKILTAWNALMIAALCALYRVSRDAQYLAAAQKAQRFIEASLCVGKELCVSFRAGKRGAPGFLDDYASYTLALLALYDATLDETYLARAGTFANKAVADFFDPDHGGFYLYGATHETLLFRPKETYDGAIPSGNSMMAYALVRLQALAPEAEREAILDKQLAFMSGEAAGYPAGYALFLIALSDHTDPPPMLTAVAPSPADLRELPFVLPLGSLARIEAQPTDAYPLKNGRATFYLCRGRSCLPPTNDLDALAGANDKA